VSLNCGPTGGPGGNGSGLANPAALRDNKDMSSDGPNLPPPGIDRVELKVTLGPAEVADGLTKLGLAKDAAPRRGIWFGERPDLRTDPPAPLLALLDRGVILRFRRIDDEPDQSTVKLRGPEGCVDPDRWAARVEALGREAGVELDAKLEGDWVAARHLISASLDNELEAGRIDEVVAERPPRVRRLLSEAQEALLGDLLLGLDGLQLLGPIQAWKWPKGAGALDDDVVAELWEVDRDLTFLELSWRVDLEEDDPADAQRRLHEALEGRHRLRIDPEQQTKTSMVLEHLARAAAEGRR
jgi:hypothetical protein